MSKRKIYCQYCNNVLFVIRKPGRATVEIICPFCGEVVFISLKGGG